MKNIISAVMVTLIILGAFAPVFKAQPAEADEAVSIRAGRSTGSPARKAARSSLSPGYYETSEYLIGSVAANIIYLESNGAIDPETEDWNDVSGEIANIQTQIPYAINWWRDQSPNACASFRGHANPSFRPWRGQMVPTSYEPINRPSADEYLWIGEAMTYLGFPGTDYYNQTVAYLNWLRVNWGPLWGSEADWAFVIFMVDSSNDADGCFSDGRFAYAYLGGPFIVMTYTNNGYGPEDLARTAAHEIGHIFYATDEDDGITEYSGYLNVADVENSGGVMNGYGEFGWYLSEGSWGQVGWSDTDGDGIQDIVDTFPDTSLNPYLPDPTTDSTLTYTGTVTEIPYPNNNPYGLGRDITVNTIANVEFRVDDGPWTNATADDGAFNETEESFSFVTAPISPGTHTIETRGTNSVGNIETTHATDVITIEGHDVAVTNVTPFKNTVGQGNSLSINVTTANQGNYPETFSVTLYANATVIETREVALASGGSATLTLTWNTESFPWGNCTLSAVADTVPDEAVTTDNTFAYSYVFVTIPGDVDGDRKVDIFDIVRLAGAYGAIAPDPKYDPNLDIDGDGDIDIFDIVIAAGNYGKSW